MKPTVLVIEDLKDTRNMVEYFLKDDFQVVTASNGSTALNLLKGFQPDLIVTDFMMPMMDGLSFIKAVKSLVHNRDIPLIVLTGYADGFRSQMLDAGALVVLEKPEGTLKLVNVIKNVLAEQCKKEKTKDE